MNTPPSLPSQYANPPAVNLSNPWFAVSIGLVGIIIGYAFGSGFGSSSGTAQANVVAPAPTRIAQAPTPALPPPPAGDPPSVDDDPFLGKKNAPVTMIEFTDYQCPFCKRHFDQTMSQIKSQYVDTGKVKYVVRDFPLSIHPNAPKASEATECAEDGGKFWEMHDLLFQKQSEWSRSTDAPSIFKQYAANLGLKTGTFDDCLDSGKYEAEVKKDFADGSAAGITGTPGFWIIGKDGKGQKLSGAQPFSSFQAVFDRYLN